MALYPKSSFLSFKRKRLFINEQPFKRAFLCHESPHMRAPDSVVMS